MSCGWVLTRSFSKVPALFLRVTQLTRSFLLVPITRMCHEDAHAAERLQRRRQEICREMLPAMTAMDTEDVVWVNADFFRRFISCTDRLDEALDATDDGPVLRHRHLLCSHETQGLHPSIARKGKLLPRKLYEFYVSNLEFEQTSRLGQSLVITDCVITPNDNIFCKKCAESYRINIAASLDVAKSFKYLWEALDPKENDVSRFKEVDEICERDEDEYVYIVARKFITRFRNAFARGMKQLASQYIGGESVARGIDDLDLTSFAITSDLSADAMDPSINGDLTCRLLLPKKMPSCILRETDHFFLSSTGQVTIISSM